MRSLAAGGGGGNVTVPHKAVAAGVGQPGPRVAMLGAANVFGAPDGELMVGNTDVDGLLALLDRLGGGAGPWCIVGTGGSAHAAVGAARERGVAVAVRSRSTERAAAFLEWAGGLGVETVDPASCRVLINATPVGLKADDPAPAPLDEFPLLTTVADLTYRPGGTSQLVATAQERGLRAADGLEMLLIQGMAAWNWWFPGVEPPEEVMRAALRGEMD
jgi:shikimate dehydrogenase